jgi:hypothetical protein
MPIKINSSTGYVVVNTPYGIKQAHRLVMLTFKPIPNAENHRFSIFDHTGNLLLSPPTKKAKDIYEVAKTPVGFSVIVTYRNILRNVLLENVPVQWGKKFIGYEETDDGVWVLFEDGSKEFCDILVGADGVNSPGKR